MGIWNWLNGKKTYIAAILTAVLAVNEVAHFLPPEVTAFVMWAATSMGLVGVGHKMDKIINA